jgi:endonuclease III related protein
MTRPRVTDRRFGAASRAGTSEQGAVARYYRALFRRYGPQRWWPGDSPFEVMVGAILAQNTAWPNAARAIGALKARGLLEPHRIDALDERALAEAIRPSGTYNVKARRLKTFARWFVRRFDGDAGALRKAAPGALRAELLALPGIGPETADCIMLYVARAPEFVVDAYTRRLASRHGLAPADAEYDELKRVFASGLPRDPALLGEYHALIVRVGKEHCRTTPQCNRCPLARYLPGIGSRRSREP